jgi:CsoR family transcriptional regulator, copper-sensing transcriptional repressor
VKKDTKHRALHRAKIIKGQLDGLEKKINEDAYCMDIVTQSLAIQKSLASLSKLMVSHHIETHIQHMLASSDEKQKEKAVAELSQLYELTNVRGK